MISGLYLTLLLQHIVQESYSFVSCCVTPLWSFHSNNSWLAPFASVCDVMSVSRVACWQDFQTARGKSDVPELTLVNPRCLCAVKWEDICLIKTCQKQRRQMEFSVCEVTEWVIHHVLVFIFELEHYSDVWITVITTARLWLHVMIRMRLGSQQFLPRRPDPFTCFNLYWGFFFSRCCI